MVLVFAVAVEDIREIRPGRTTKVHRDSRMPAGYPDDWAFSIVYGDDLRTLDLIAHSSEDARIWVAGLCALLGNTISEYLIVENVGWATRLVSSPLLTTSAGKHHQ